MGTSASSTGPGSKSPLVPPWADDRPQEPLPTPKPKRFADFRRAIGQFIKSNDDQELRKGLRHYAGKSTGGGEIAARHMGSVTRTGGLLFDALIGRPVSSNERDVNLEELSGRNCEEVISIIAESLTPEDGDAAKIKKSMTLALAEALDGIEIFDDERITDDIIISTMINYLAEAIFLQMVNDLGKSWNKAKSPERTLEAEKRLQEVIKVVVDKHMDGKLSGDIRSFTRQQMIEIERQTIIDVWKEWETYE